MVEPWATSACICAYFSSRYCSTDALSNRTRDMIAEKRGDGVGCDSVVASLAPRRAENIRVPRAGTARRREPDLFGFGLATRTKPPRSTGRRNNRLHAPSGPWPQATNKKTDIAFVSCGTAKACVSVPVHPRRHPCAGTYRWICANQYSIRCNNLSCRRRSLSYGLQSSSYSTSNSETDDSQTDSSDSDEYSSSGSGSSPVYARAVRETSLPSTSTSS
jgi:hypothetical protein